MKDKNNSNELKANDIIYETYNAYDGFILIDSNTGEKIDELNPGDKIVHISEEQLEFLANYQTNFKEGGGFIKVFLQTKFLNKELSTKEKAVLFEILPYISYSDGVLRDGNATLDLKTLSEILDENYDRFRKIISGLIKKEIMAKIKTDDERGYQTYCYVMNPYLFFRGSYVKKSLLSIFQFSKWATL